MLLDYGGLSHLIDRHPEMIGVVIIIGMLLMFILPDPRDRPRIEEMSYG